MQFYANECNEGETLTPNPNECNSTLTSGTSGGAAPTYTVYTRGGVNCLTIRVQFYANGCNEGRDANPNECNSTLTSGTNNIYPYPYIDVNDRGHRFRSGSPLTNYPHAPTPPSPTSSPVNKCSKAIYSIYSQR